ncbi:LuxR family two component transcriptional regulator [Nitrospirillum pindoramense]|uniref:LuxR family two component transcriptional regulator n=2 Tax=Nitrospirillum amazonense TaxID=28077 RepID=A0A560H4C7_9PROT|nr:LuxR family two component transcriptional regulator [Nitrospirillum amazonense]
MGELAMTARSVLLIDQDQLFGAALGTLLGEDSFQLLPPVPSVEEAIRVLRDMPAPDLIMVDPWGIDPPRVASELRRLRAAAPQPRIAVLTSDTSDSVLKASLFSGMDGHLSKSSGVATLRDALELILAGDAVFPPRATALVTQAQQPQGPTPADLVAATADLSRREIQILGCLLAGQSNKSIARRLEITESTVKMHFKNVMRKIGAQNRTQAAVWAIQRGIGPLT